MTLIELILALALSSLIINSIFAVYLIAENARLAQKSLITLQQNVQVISQLFKYHIRLLPYAGCAKLTETFPFENHLSFALPLKNHIMAYRDSDSKAGTDAIRIWHASSESAVLLKKMHGYASLSISSTIPIEVNDNLIISDCKTTETLRVKKMFREKDGVLKIIPVLPLNKLYEKNAEINKLEIEEYFIGASDQLDQDKQPIYSLFSKDSEGNKIELAEGISQMKIFFSTIENNQLTEHPLNDLTDSTEINGISFAFESASVSDKKWNVYVALS